MRLQGSLTHRATFVRHTVADMHLFLHNMTHALVPALTQRAPLMRRTVADMHTRVR